MWFNMGVFYILLGLSVIGLLFLEIGPLPRVIGIVCALAGFYLLTLLLIGWRKKARTPGAQPPAAVPCPAPTKTRLPFRIAGVVLAIVSLPSGCLILAMLASGWTDALKHPVISLVLAGMGLCAVFSGSLFGYCCLAGKEWPIRAIRR
jgi:hypothetical protein